MGGQKSQQMAPGKALATTKKWLPGGASWIKLRGITANERHDDAAHASVGIGREGPTRQASTKNKTPHLCHEASERSTSAARRGALVNLRWATQRRRRRSSARRRCSSLRMGIGCMRGANRALSWAVIFSNQAFIRVSSNYARLWWPLDFRVAETHPVVESKAVLKHCKSLPNVA